MILCLDAAYGNAGACVAGVAISDWGDSTALLEKFVLLGDVAPYEPGHFYRRELPCLLACIEQFDGPGCIVIDGYVSLDAAGTPGLGGHLFDALHRKVPVIGVAKTKFKDAGWATPIVRGTGGRALYITSAGMEAGVAAANVKRMHGGNRIPTLLKQVDRLCRENLKV